MTDHLDILLRRAVDPSTLRRDGIYTEPRSFGVYELPEGCGAPRLIRVGNHPIREEELIRQYGSCDRIAVFLDRTDAELTATALRDERTRQARQRPR